MFVTNNGLPGLGVGLGFPSVNNTRNTSNFFFNFPIKSNVQGAFLLEVILIYYRKMSDGKMSRI